MGFGVPSSGLRSWDLGSKFKAWSLRCRIWDSELTHWRQMFAMSMVQHALQKSTRC